MKYHFSRITEWTIVLTVFGLLSTVALMYFTIKPSNDLPKEIILTAKDSDNSEVNVDTLRFYSRAQLSYDSGSIFIDHKKKIDKVDASKFFFHYNPEFLVWLVLVTIMMAIATGVLPSLLDRLYYLKSMYKINKWRIALFFSVAIVIGLIFFIVLVINPYLYTYTDWICLLGILFEHTFPLYVIIAIPTISGLTGLVGILFISKSVENLSLNQSQTDSFIEKFKRLSQLLKFFLTIATTLITLGVFTTGALRIAILQEVVVKGINMIPVEFVYLYGLQFTIVLAIFYLPIYYQLKSKAQFFVKSYEGKSGVKHESIKNIEALMQESPIDALKMGLSIIAPILGSFLPELIKF